ncbi:hypothetical protein GCM10023081_18500 [Arthrobacter ginkgonis]|uniref:Uncharacterized protein n=1 Tax=Arthrobacter ginkgonis TaxID=1630594 RepID=A0ABP7C858_9MICC
MALMVARTSRALSAERDSTSGPAKRRWIVAEGKAAGKAPEVGEKGTPLLSRLKGGAKEGRVQEFRHKPILPAVPLERD